MSVDISLIKDTSALAKIDLTKPIDNIRWLEINKWVEAPWQGAIEIPGFSYDPATFIKDDQAVGGMMFVDSIEYTAFPMPLIKLGCGCPVSMLTRSETKNKAIVRAMMLNAIKLFTHANGPTAPAINFFWDDIFVACGSDISEKLSELLTPFAQVGCLRKVETLEHITDCTDPHPDLFPFNRDNCRGNWGHPAKFEGLVNLKEDPMQAAWLKQIQLFLNAKLSWIKVLRLSGADKMNSTFSYSPFQLTENTMRNTLQQGFSLITKDFITDSDFRSKLMEKPVVKRYAANNKEGLDTFLKAGIRIKYQLTKAVAFSPAASAAYSFKYKKYAYAYHGGWANLVERAATQVGANAADSIRHNRGTRSRGGISYNDFSLLKPEAVGAHLSGELNFGCMTHEALGQWLKVLASTPGANVNGLYDSKGELSPSNPYFSCGLPDTPEVHSMLLQQGIRDVPEFFWPSKLKETCLELLDLEEERPYDNAKLKNAF